MIIPIVYVFNNRKKTLVMDVHPKKKGMSYLRSISSPSIDNVLYVKKLKHNLLNISQLCDSAYDISFNKAECIVKDCKSSIIFSAKR
ncbi:hypothetical protein CR513_29777, partial [Mucuna pruriens]